MPTIGVRVMEYRCTQVLRVDSETRLEDVLIKKLSGWEAAQATWENEDSTSTVMLLFHAPRKALI